MADPPTHPDPGRKGNETAHHAMWAGDEDATTLSAGREDATVSALLASTTDIPLDSPPSAVERWNRRVLSSFPATNPRESIHPPNATLVDGEFVADVTTSVFTVQPSTQTRISPGDHPLYVAPNGTLYGTVDYRVALPKDERTANRTITWTRESHTIDDVRLLVDGSVETTTEGTHTPRLVFDLVEVAGRTHTLTLEADIAVTVEQRTEWCHNRTANGTCQNSTVAIDRQTEIVTASDSITVEEYRPVTSGYTAQYPDGDRGFVIYASQPWLGYELPVGGVRGVWRFYAARDTAWDTLVTSTANGETTNHSTVHPLQVTAYPSATGPTATGYGSVVILQTYGEQRQAPTLPENVRLDVVEEEYTASFGVAARMHRSANPHSSSMLVRGLVRGVDAETRPADLVTVPINRSNLSLTLANTTGQSVTVRVSLRDAQSGAPIETSDRGGYLVLEGERVNTTANGTASVTLSRPVGTLSARYEPGRWWYESVGYVGDSDIVSVRGAGSRPMAILYTAGVPISLFLASVFLVDRTAGWRLWPPWRGL